MLIYILASALGPPEDPRDLAGAMFTVQSFLKALTLE